MIQGAKGILQLCMVLAVVAGSFLAASYMSSLREEPESLARFEERRPVVEAKRVEPANRRVRFETTGTVQVRSFVSIVPQVSGKVVRVSEDLYPGGVFGANSLLFRIEPDDFQHQVQRLQAEVARAETQLQLSRADAEASVSAWRGMHPDQSPPPLVAKRPQLEEARAALKAAKARLATARLNLERTRFSLPFRGRVVESSLEAGQFVTAGQSFGRAYSLDALEIAVPLEDRQIRWIRRAEAPQLRVRSDYLGEAREYETFVKRFGAEADPRTRFTRVFLGLDEPNTDLVPGVFVTVEAIGALERDVWVMPLSSLNAGETIWAIDERNRLKRLSPDIIQITSEHVVARGNGSAVRVVTSPLPPITENTRVRVLDDETR
jgi:RND family efflux transporter MFP subunit